MINGRDTVDETLWILISQKEALEELIRMVGYPRYEPIKSASIHYPPINLNSARVCPYCGRKNCGSDHK